MVTGGRRVAAWLTELLSDPKAIFSGFQQIQLTFWNPTLFEFWNTQHPGTWELSTVIPLFSTEGSGK